MTFLALMGSLWRIALAFVKGNVAQCGRREKNHDAVGVGRLFSGGHRDRLSERVDQEGDELMTLLGCGLVILILALGWFCAATVKHVLDRIDNEIDKERN